MAKTKSNGVGQYRGKPSPEAATHPQVRGDYGVWLKRTGKGEWLPATARQAQGEGR